MTIDNTKLECALRTRIRGELVDLISDEDWTKLLHQEIEHFCTSTTKEVSHYNYSHAPKKVELPSTLRAVARDVLRAEVKTRLTAMLNEPEWATMWVEGREQAGQKIKDMVREQSAAIFEDMIGRAIVGTVDSLRHDLGKM